LTFAGVLSGYLNRSLAAFYEASVGMVQVPGTTNEFFVAVGAWSAGQAGSFELLHWASSRLTPLVNATGAPGEELGTSVAFAGRGAVAVTNAAGAVFETLLLSIDAGPGGSPLWSPLAAVPGATLESARAGGGVGGLWVAASTSAVGAAGHAGLVIAGAAGGC
jgi:hypothetical protein